MNCVCGYEQIGDFKEASTTKILTIDAYGGIGKNVKYDCLYVCPKCGTVKMKVGDEE